MTINQRLLLCHTSFSAKGPHDWVSVTYGTFICSDCAYIHRTLGIENSHILSVSVDIWSEAQIYRMRLGGNHKFKEFLGSAFMSSRGDSAIRSKYKNYKKVRKYRQILDEYCERVGIGNEAGWNLYAKLKGSKKDDSERKLMETSIIIKDVMTGKLRTAWDLNGRVDTFEGIQQLKRGNPLTVKKYLGKSSSVPVIRKLLIPRAERSSIEKTVAEPVERLAWV
mmetsp:Transcript_26880/g.37513  ORF Transcript_26880/g.37513 Transcript_26880/m.37513 type:complete len:223 (+) Transcript_26880:368-1036(+)